MLRQACEMGRRRARPRVAAALAGVALIAATGCGGSSKPGYCSDRSSLQKSIEGLPSAASSAVSSGDVSGLKSQLTKVQSDATSLVDSAKSDFPDQTSAVKSSVSALQTAVSALPSSPSATQVAVVATSASSVVNAVKSFDEASKSKCD